MMYLRRSRFFRTVVLPLTLVVWVSACGKTVTVLYPPPYETLALEEPGVVTVTLGDGSRMSVHNPRIESDSLVGTVYDARDRAYTDTVSVALAEITSVETEKAEKTPTWGWVVGGALAVGVIVWAISFSKHCDENPGTLGCR